MSAPPPLDQVPPPDWLGEPLTGKGAPGETGEADGVATGADVGGLAGAAGGLGGGFGLAMDGLGGSGTFVSQYKQSTATHEGFKIADAIVGGAADIALGKAPLLPEVGQSLIPVVDGLIIKPVAKAVFKVDFSVGDTVSAGVRALTALAEGLSTDSREAMARTRARAEMGEMGSLSKGVARFVAWLRS